MFPYVICLDSRHGSTNSFWSPCHGLKRFSFVYLMWSFLLCDCSSTSFGEWCQFICNNIIYILSYDHIDPMVSRSLLCSLYVSMIFPLICLHLGASRCGNVISGVVYVFIKFIAPVKVLAITLTWGHTLYSLVAHTHFSIHIFFQDTSFPFLD